MADRPEPIHTRCPACHTTFRLRASLLDVAQGRVRCSHCGRVFDGVTQRVEVAPIAVGDDANITPEMHPEVVYGLDQERAAPRRSPLSGAVLAAVGLLLLALLGWQAYHGLREPLLASPTVRPWLERACDRLGCSLPALRDPGQIEIISRNVRSHPRVESALLVDLTMVNRAPFPQPFPLLLISFSNLDASWTAQRRFTPDNYLGGQRDAGETMPRDVPVQAVLELVDPGIEAISFSFDLQ